MEPMLVTPETFQLERLPLKFWALRNMEPMLVTPVKSGLSTA